MFLDPLILMLLLITAALGFVAFVFLPAAIEILKPRDKGPRRILKTPFQKMMRHGPRLALTPKPASVNKNTSKDLQDILRDIGIKTRRIGNDTIRILGGVAIPPNLEIADNVVVEGSLVVGDQCVFHGSVKANGSVFIGLGVVIKGNLISKGNVNIQDEAVVGGSVHAGGLVRLGEKVFIGLSVVADGDVELYENSEVKKNILTPGVIKVLKHPQLDYPSTIEDIG